MSLKSIALLAAIGAASAFSPSLPVRGAPRAAVSGGLRMQQAPVDVLDKVEELKLLTAVSKSGLLSRLEQDKTLSKLEESGALSKLETLLPIADEIGAISLLKKAVNFSPGALKTGAFFLASAETGLILAVPDNSGALVAAQAASAFLVVAAMAPLVIAANILEIVQGETPVELPNLRK